MSIRAPQEQTYASAVRADLNQLKATAAEATRLENIDQTARPVEGEAAAAYDALAPHEQAAASLGVHPDSLRPIGFLNAGHYDQLRKSNALSDDLSRRIEAYKKVATDSQ